MKNSLELMLIDDLLKLEDLWGSVDAGIHKRLLKEKKKLLKGRKSDV